ncbi:hypothetical protein CLV51_103353 [Chitinophaga niastensis]|uniref:Uncharacterized protein n=1 Tax=Chitinophaga niastensis TaxID=536980 RepID=A0A2P8HJJ9_CHINA|nr:hypothetical protein [Chitinophaga niastensis]PSL46375.1 hypothetical protein CLV51_103353 [Chitinophaga niastensis]
METLNHILIFKTNIATTAARQQIATVLDMHPLIAQWTVDLMDVDCVLRVVSYHLSPADVIAIVARYNYECTELTD